MTKGTLIWLNPFASQLSGLAAWLGKGHFFLTWFLTHCGLMPPRAALPKRLRSPRVGKQWEKETIFTVGRQDFPTMETKLRGRHWQWDQQNRERQTRTDENRRRWRKGESKAWDPFTKTSYIWHPVSSQFRMTSAIFGITVTCFPTAKILIPANMRCLLDVQIVSVLHQ